LPYLNQLSSEVPARPPAQAAVRLEGRSAPRRHLRSCPYPRAARIRGIVHRQQL